MFILVKVLTFNVMQFKNKIPVAMTIAGSDSVGGAGIQADLKTFAALGVHGTTAITAITAQNTYSVTAIQEIDPSVVVKQIETVYEDTGIDAAKTGMLSNKDIISSVSKTIKKLSIPLVIDPVMVAKSGARLLKEDAIEVLIKELIPLAWVVTPNIPEAEIISGIKINSADDMELAAKKIFQRTNCKAVIVKGGHLNVEKSTDVIFYDGRIVRIESDRIQTKNTHGTGCSFSAAIAAEISKGNDILTSIKRAKDFINYAIKYALPIGKGHGPVNPTSWLEIRANKLSVLENLRIAINILESEKLIANLVPEVQMNIGMALDSLYARSIEDVAAIPGRIVKIKDKVKSSSYPEFGASSHIARAILKAMEYDIRYKSAANIKYDELILEAAKRLGFSISYYDRKEEPEDLKNKEGATIPWGVEIAIKRLNHVPDIIYDKGDIGKEPIIKVFGYDSIDVANKLVKLAKMYNDLKAKQFLP